MFTLPSSRARLRNKFVYSKCPVLASEKDVAGMGFVDSGFNRHLSRLHAVHLEDDSIEFELRWVTRTVTAPDHVSIKFHDYTSIVKICIGFGWEPGLRPLLYPTLHATCFRL
jgi:hypothetical protein